MQKVIQGQVTAIEPRNNDWFAVHILAPGKQYPVKLSTKRQDILQDAQSLAWQMVDALYNEETSDTINPKSGQPYINRYLEQLAPAGSINIPQPMTPLAATQQQPMAVPTTGLLPQAQPQQFGNLTPQLPPPPVQQVSPPGMVQQWPGHVDNGSEREDRIMRQAATKVAAAFLPSLSEEDQNLGSLIRISEQLLKYYKEGVSWEVTPQSIAAASPIGDEPGFGDPGPQAGDPGAFPEGY